MLELVGKTLDEARNICWNNFKILRVVKLDGKDLFGTMDARSNRINFEVEDGKIKQLIDIG